jgi:hypothetical protein
LVESQGFPGEKTMDVKAILDHLKVQRDQLSKAIDALSGGGGVPSPFKAKKYGPATSFNPTEFEGKPRRKKMSKSARAKIAAAQRARWAKVKAK